ncbi:MAG: hypothetical protein ACXVWW_07330 [Nocardioides sp.]
MNRRTTALRWIAVYALFATAGIGLGRELALRADAGTGAIVLAASNTTAGNSGGVGNGHAPFTIASTAVTGLQPGGAAKPLALTLTNTDNSPYQVLTLQIDVNNPNGCVAASNLVIGGLGRAQLIGPANAYSSAAAGAPQLVIPKNGHLAVPGLSIRMLDVTTRSQDACKNQRFTLSYSGTATQGN